SAHTSNSATSMSLSRDGFNIVSGLRTGKGKRKRDVLSRKVPESYDNHCFRYVSPMFQQRFNSSYLGAGAAFAAIMCVFSCSIPPAESQGRLRQRLQQRMQQRAQQRAQQQSAASQSAGAASRLRHFKPDESISIAGVDVSIWRPKGAAAPAPLVVFSHWFHGCSTQTTFLMKAL